ncbi:hypothetical protein D0869_10188 [Hortaea werneckii]|uniref:Plasma membrane proteolipid 3 n=1 Tax=Hortaea werneckii TaxID=91943 RepID=A0A3M6WEN3_HORWE|nr:hypothetical protein KC324_g13440 [Hortaea werneckii]KAI7557438.1 hypothetical protein KC316_g13474 [Hortaea werneckii]RMX77027.1 hypothetical protein D0869_10188 [Hortaea werneckii]
MAGGGLMYRFWVIVVNLILPPLAVALLAGVDVDFLVNCALFLLAVIPSHIHGFYISMVYFHRRKKVRKGQYPGGSKSFIFSKSILNGGASDAEVDRLWRKERGLETKGSTDAVIGSPGSLKGRLSNTGKALRSSLA